MSTLTFNEETFGLTETIANIRERVRGAKSADDVTAIELIDALDLVWALAERWRIEQDPELMAALDLESEVDGEEQKDAFSAGGAGQL